jgi:hypothetical protein
MRVELPSSVCGDRAGCRGQKPVRIRLSLQYRRRASISALPTNAIRISPRPAIAFHSARGELVISGKRENGLHQVL